MLQSCRRVFLLSALAALLAALLAAGCSRSEQEPTEFRIGMIAPITHSVRFTGHLLAQARVDELNAQGGVEIGGRKLKVRLFVEDADSRVELAMSAMSRLIQQERVSAIIGPYYSRDAIPVAAAVESLRVPMLSPSATNPAVTRGHSYAFRVCQVDSDQGAALARYAHDELGLRKAAVLYDEADAYSAGLAGYFREAFASYPGTALVSERYTSGTTDFSDQLARIRAAHAQVLLLPNFPPDLALQLPQARAAGFAGLFLGGDSWDTDAGFHSLPEAQGSVYSTDYSDVAADPRLLASAQALAAKSGSEVVKNTALTLDALELVIAAAQRVGSTDPVSLRSGLAELSGFEGLTGLISFTGRGDPERSVYVVGIDGGSLALRARLAPAHKRQGNP
jgi:branched-chain amino acid transport system substrate-binding protein